MALNWKEWFNAYEIHATAAGVARKSEKVQCCVFLHVAGWEAQKLHQTFTFGAAEKDKYTPLVEALWTYCQGKDNIIVVRYKFNTFKQRRKTWMDTFIREMKQGVAM